MESYHATLGESESGDSSPNPQNQERGDGGQDLHVNRLVGRNRRAVGEGQNPASERSRFTRSPGPGSGPTKAAGRAGPSSLWTDSGRPQRDLPVPGCRDRGGDRLAAGKDAQKTNIQVGQGNLAGGRGGRKGRVGGHGDRGVDPKAGPINRGGGGGGPPNNNKPPTGGKGTGGDDKNSPCYCCQDPSHPVRFCPCAKGICEPQHGKRCPNLAMYRKARKEFRAEEKARVGAVLDILGDCPSPPKDKPELGSGKSDGKKATDPEQGILEQVAALKKVLEDVQSKNSTLVANEERLLGALSARDEPVNAIVTYIDANMVHINSWLLARPCLGVGDTVELKSLIRSRSGASGFEDWLGNWWKILLGLPPTPPSRSIQTLENLVKKMPHTYEEHYIGFVEFNKRSVEAFNKALTAIGLAAALPALTMSTNPIIKLVGGTMGGIAVHALFTKMSRRKIIKVVHHFEYEALPHQEQVELSHDRRNISFRLARPVETSYGVRVKHWVDFQYSDLDDGIILTALDAVGLKDLATQVVFNQIPVGAIIGLDDEVDGLPRVALQVEPRNDPNEVRHRLAKTLPSIDSTVVDVTLWDWMATHSRFMDVSRPFADVKSFLRLSYCANGQIANDLMSGDYRSLYPATATLTLVTWLHQRFVRGGQWVELQDWGF